MEQPFLGDVPLIVKTDDNLLARRSARNPQEEVLL